MSILKKRFLSLLLLLCFTIATQVHGQYYQFSQFYPSTIQMCPSFAGLGEGARFALINRQSPDLDGFSTYTFSGDFSIKRFNSGIGFVLFRDQIGGGNLMKTGIGVDYAYNIRISKQWNFRPGINFNYTVQTINFFNLVFSDQLRLDHPIATTTMVETPPMENKGYIDFTSSGLFYSERQLFGFQLNHLFRPQLSYTDLKTQLPLELLIYGYLRFDLTKRRDSPFREYTDFALSMLYKTFNNTHLIDLNLYFHVLNKAYAGFGIRGTPLKTTGYLGAKYVNALVLNMGLSFGGVTVGYSYDFMVGEFVNYHEISIIYDMGKARVEEEVDEL